jgi:4-diphosphocytidyl-2-C-methyl-D-erythritol kinase
MPGDRVELAPAKVNLALHVTGRRPDGYHLLDSLVVFPEIGDRLAAEPAPRLSLEIDGPFAAGLGDGEDNLVIRAARLLGDGRGATLRLHKALPVASGIGGGSADAAAALRLLARLWDLALPPAGAALALGADVPVCLRSRSGRMRGIGEAFEPLELPSFAVLLVNPGIPVSTGGVFARLASRENPPLSPPPRFADAGAFVAWLAMQRNDLESPARALAPAIDAVLAALAAQPGCALARMSGSGATCFGLFEREAEAAAAAAALARERPDWWIAAAPVAGAQQRSAEPAARRA